ncbi:glycosyltransferase 29 protein [Cymbomonas tetramitiformis]|uniref:beta-galactoside alpha-(2,6)-sialyltransferase n=1 Tax=Cymbomonas tetramitiformis TaxID=36881 RepID=A0AAE0EQ57_9CHLO|nr:glycosyltransferase 29 protein [Cymbomonas tetramitiformis]
MLPEHKKWRVLLILLAIGLATLHLSRHPQHQIGDHGFEGVHRESKVSCYEEVRPLQETLMKLKARYSELKAELEKEKQRADKATAREGAALENARRLAAQAVQLRAQVPLGSRGGPAAGQPDTLLVDPAIGDATDGEAREWAAALRKASHAILTDLAFREPSSSANPPQLFATPENFARTDSTRVSGMSSVTSELSPEDEILFNSSVGSESYDSCALVGNARSLLSIRQGSVIDGHDAVMRINQAETTGYEEHIGERTTWRLLNHKWAELYKRMPDLPLEANTTLLFSRTSLGDFIKVARVVHARRPEVKMKLVTRVAVDRVGGLLRQLRSRVEEVRGAAYPGRASPSSGFVGAYLLLQMCKTVEVYGVGDGLKGSWHYFEDRNFADSREFSKDPHHSFILEHDMLQVLDAGGVLRHHAVEGGLNATSAMHGTVTGGGPLEHPGATPPAADGQPEEAHMMAFAKQGTQCACTKGTL